MAFSRATGVFPNANNSALVTPPFLPPPPLNSTPSSSNMANKNSPAVISNDRISEAEDKAMDKEIPSTGHVEPGISIRMGPVDDMDVDEPATNGNANGKRKARSSITNGKTYKDDSSSDDDDKPLVRTHEICQILSVQGY